MIVLEAISIVIALTLAIGFPAGAQEPAWPTGTVRLIVGYAPGGATDTLARILVADLGTAFSQSFSVENRSGASGTLGLELASRAPPDGQTLVLINSTHASWKALGGRSSVDVLRDFEPVALLGHSPVVFAVSARVHTTSLRDFIRATRQRPGTATYASCGVGTASHVAGEMLQAAAGIRMIHVPYRGCAPAVQDALGGRVDMLIASATSVLPHVGAGRLQAYAATSSQRLAAAPDIATVSELGYPEAAVEVWHGVLAPAHTPREVIERLQDEIRRVLDREANRKRLAQVGIDAEFGSGDAFGSLFKSELDKYRDVVERGKLRSD